jgi:hypothetical protein
MTANVFLCLIVLLVVLSLYFKVDNFLKLGIPFILIGVTFSTDSVNQTESFFITIFFVLQIFLGLSLPEKYKTKLSLKRFLPFVALVVTVFSMSLYLNNKAEDNLNSVQSISQNNFLIESNVYLIILILILILFSSTSTKRDKKWN